MSELKPCPFCGGNATLWSDGYMEYVECDVCGAKSQSCYDPQLAVRKWSTRREDFVRCHDCKYYEDTGNCTFFYLEDGCLGEVTPEGFCAW